jgi:hypothetical protein
MFHGYRNRINGPHRIQSQQTEDRRLQSAQQENRQQNALLCGRPIVPMLEMCWSRVDALVFTPCSHILHHPIKVRRIFAN